MPCWEVVCEDVGSSLLAARLDFVSSLAREYSLARVRSRGAMAAIALIDDLINTRRALDLSSCRGLCGIPASITRKKDLVEALLLKTRCPRKREAVIRHLTDKMTGHALRSWISSLRRAGSKVPDAKVMNRGRAEILDAIIHLECPPAGEYSSADSDGESSVQEGETHEKAQGQCPAPAGEYSSADHTASASQPMGCHDVGTVLVAYDAANSPAISRRKLGKKWMKLARKAFMRSQLPKRVRKAVAEALQEYPDATVLTLRGVVEGKVGADLSGKYGVLFDKALLRDTAQPEKPLRPRTRFILAVGHRRAKRARR